MPDNGEVNIREMLAPLYQAATREELQNELSNLAEAFSAGNGQRGAIADELLAELECEKTPRNRGRILTLLAELEATHLVDQISQYTAAKQEPSSRVQFRALLAVARLASENLAELLKPVIKDARTGSRTKAAALRLLAQASPLEEVVRKSYFEQLLALAEDGNADNRWAALASLSNDDAWPEPLSKEYEKEAIEKVLGPRLRDEGEWRDVRSQAARSLGKVQHNRAVAISTLSHIYKTSRTPEMRLRSIEALTVLGQSLNGEGADPEDEAVEQAHTNEKEEITAVMLQALQDDDLDIQNRAINALRELRPDDVLTVIATAMLQQDEIQQGHINALRQINSIEAAKSLTQELLSPDPRTADRAGAALRELGGETAMRSLLAQRQEFVSTYTTMLDKADERVMTQHKQLMQRAGFAFSISLGMHIIIFISGLIILTATIYLASDSPDGITNLFLGITGTVGSFMAAYMTLFYKGPLQNIRRTTTDLVKTNIAFSGYMRQINQIDATFKHLFLSPAGFTLDDMNRTVNQIESTVNESLRKVEDFIS